MREPTRNMLLLAALVVGSAGCSSLKPVLYPNQHYQEVGEAGAERDVAYCMQQADQFVKTGGANVSMAKDAAVEGAKGGAFGAAVGVVGGAVTGNAAEGAAVGAATGATAGVVNSLFGGVFQTHREPDPIYGNFVNTCLSERGYQVIGWQ